MQSVMGKQPVFFLSIFEVEIMEKKLTLKQQRFITEYIKTGNGTQSAITAGYSKHTANEIAAENLAKPSIKLKIEKVMSEEAKKLGITAEYVLSNIKQIAENESEKVIPTKLKANELLGRHLKLFHEGEMDVTLKEHRETIKQLQDLE